MLRNSCVRHDFFSSASCHANDFGRALGREVVYHWGFVRATPAVPGCRHSCWGKFHGPDVSRGGVQSQIDGPCAICVGPGRHTARLRFAITEEREACAVLDQIQMTIKALTRDRDSEGLLPSAQGGVVGHDPVLVGRL